MSAFAYKLSFRAKQIADSDRQKSAISGRSDERVSRELPADHLMRDRWVIDLPRPAAHANADGVVQSFGKIGGSDHDCNHRA